MNEPEVLEVLGLLEAAYREEVPDPTRAVWCRMLADLDAPAVLSAARGHMATSRWFPSIAEIRALATQHELGAPDEAEAWEQAKALARHRPLDGIKASGETPAVHPLVARVVGAIGADYIANSYEDDPWARKHFTEVYRHIQARAERRLALGTPEQATLGDPRLRELARRVGKEPE